MRKTICTIRSFLTEYGWTHPIHRCREELKLWQGVRSLDRRRAGAKMLAMTSTLNSRIAMINLPDSDGRELVLGSLWLRQPAVVVFLRHYG